MAPFWPPLLLLWVLVRVQDLSSPVAHPGYQVASGSHHSPHCCCSAHHCPIPSHLAAVPRSQEHIQMASDHLLREAPHCKRTHHTGKPRLLGISPHFILQYIHMSSCISKVIRLALLVTNHTTNLASETREGIHISASFPVPLPKTRTAERDLHRKPHSSVRPDHGVYGTSTELCSPLGCPTATSLCLPHSAPRPWEGRPRQQGAVLLQRNARPL